MILSSTAATLSLPLLSLMVTGSVARVTINDKIKIKQDVMWKLWNIRQNKIKRTFSQVLSDQQIGSCYIFFHDKTQTHYEILRRMSRVGIPLCPELVKLELEY